MYEPALSTISLPISQMGDEALKLVVSVMKRPDSKNKLVVLQNELIV